MAEQRGRGWRAAFQSVRRACTPSSVCLVVPQFLSQASNLLHDSPELSSQEISADIVFLVQTVSKGWCVLDGADAPSICRTVCYLVIDVCSHFRLEFETPALHILLQFLRGLIASFHSSSVSKVVIPEEGGSGASVCKAGMEALCALVQVVHDNGGQLPVDEVTTLVTVLLGLITHQGAATLGQHGKQSYRATPRLDASVYTEAGTRTCGDERDCQRLALLAIGKLFSRAGPSISKETWVTTVQALRNVLDVVTSNSPLPEDSVSSRYYGTLLHCVHLVLSDPKGSVEEHVAGYVVALRMFFTYGLTNLRPVPGCSNGSLTRGNWGGAVVSTVKDTGVYRPPHVRGKLKAQTCLNGAVGGGLLAFAVQKEGVGEWVLSSDSEQSDSDGPLGDGDWFKSSKPRTNAVLSIQALARADPKSLHAHWVVLLPTHDVLLPRPFQASLLTTLLFDPIVKARMAAASTVAAMLEGPARAFLQVAEHRQISRSGPFTTLSSSLGQIVIQLHTGLVHVVLHEKQVGTLVAALKALSLLVSAAPFGRLPAELLPNVVMAVHQRTLDLLPLCVEQSNSMTAAVCCLGAALSASPASPQVAAMLGMDCSSVIKNSTRPQALLRDLISYTQPPAPLAVRVEALQAIKAAVHNYSWIAFSFWGFLSKVVAGVIHTMDGKSSFGSTVDGCVPLSSFLEGVTPTGVGQSAGLADDRLVHSAVKLLDELLRAISGSKGLDDVLEDGPRKPPSPSFVPKPLKLLCGSSATCQQESGVLESCQTTIIEAGEEAGSSQWLEVLDHHLPPVLVHSAPMVRGAALTCFAGLTAAAFSEFSPSKQDFVLSTVMYAALNDSTPAVRSTACRAIGVVVGFPHISESKERVLRIINVILATMEDSSASVRITASWALANLCDVLGNSCETASSQEIERTLETGPLTSLAECTFRAVKNGDKVRANAVRALGNLARFANFCNEPSGARCNSYGQLPAGCNQTPGSTNIDTSAAHVWLGRMAQTFVSCVTTGNVKVQWNVCHALGNLFLNPTIQLSSMSWVPSVYSILLLLLRDSANFKIRIHAAAALSVPASREDYVVAYGDVVQALVHALAYVDMESGMGPTSFKYQLALKEQLTLTALHVLRLGHPEDFHVLQDTLVKREVFLYDWLSTICSSIKKIEAATDIQYSDEGFRRNAVGVAATSISSGRALENDDKSWPLPRDRRGYGFAVQDSCNDVGNDAMACKVRDARHALKALSEMYRYGGHQISSTKLQKLLG